MTRYQVDHRGDEYFIGKGVGTSYGRLPPECQRVVERFKGAEAELSNATFQRYEANAGHIVTTARVGGGNRGMGIALKNSCDPDRPEVGMAVALGRALEDAGYQRISTAALEESGKKTA